MSKNVNDVASKLIKKSKGVVTIGKKIKEDGFSFAILKELTEEVTVIVETYTDDVGILSSKAKIELAVSIINILVDIPYVPEWLETKIFKYAVAKAIKYLNDTFGKNWVAKKLENK
jgi:hypothetical protein